MLSVQQTTPAKEQLSTYFTQKVVLPKEDYVTGLYELKLDDTGVKSQALSAATKQWLTDQIAHAEKAP